MFCSWRVKAGIWFVWTGAKNTNVNVTKWNSTGCSQPLWLRLLCPWTLTFSPENLIGMSPCRPRYICDLSLVKLAPIVTQILYSSVFRVIACCDLWPQNLTSTSMNLNTSVKNWVTFPSLVFKLWCSQYFWVIGCCDLDLWPFHQILGSQTRYKYSLFWK